MCLISKNCNAHFWAISINNSEKLPLSAVCGHRSKCQHSSENSSENSSSGYNTKSLEAEEFPINKCLSGVGAFNTNKSSSPQRRFDNRNLNAIAGRSPQSTNRPSSPERSAETNVCSNNISFMKTANGAATPDPNSSISCKYSDCNSTNLQTRERPDTPHYAELICCECGRHQKWLGNLEKQQQQRERIERLWFLRNRLNDWDKGFLDNVRLSKKLSPKQQAQLDRIEREVGGLK